MEQESTVHTPWGGAQIPEGASILVGNSFPLSLVRRRVQIDPLALDEARQVLACRKFVSFWGHENTLRVAENLLGVDLSPRSARPALTLDAENLPCLDEISSPFVLVVCPEYVAGFRPGIGTEVPPEKIRGFQSVVLNFL